MHANVYVYMCVYNDCKEKIAALRMYKKADFTVSADLVLYFMIAQFN